MVYLKWNATKNCSAYANVYNNVEDARLSLQDQFVRDLPDNIFMTSDDCDTVVAAWNVWDFLGDKV